MLASQMADAQSEATTVNIDAKCVGINNEYVFRATGSVLRFAGFRVLYLESSDEDEDGDNKKTLPPIESNDGLECSNLECLQHSMNLLWLYLNLSFAISLLIHFI